MKLFLTKIFKLCFFILIIFWVCFILYLKDDGIKIEDKVSVLIMGDSNTQCSINDSTRDDILNISKSGESYFFTYLKLRNILKKKKINKVFISFSPHNILKTEISPDRIKTKGYLYNEIINYLPLMNIEDMLTLIKIDKKSFFYSLLKLPLHSILDKKNIGGFIILNRSSLEKDLIKLKNKNNIFNYDNFEISYLKKIEEILDKHQTKLIFINTPKHKDYYMSNNNFETFYDFYYKTFEKLNFWDLNQEIIENKYFSDFIHLNYDGSEIFTKSFLKKLDNFN